MARSTYVYVATWAERVGSSGPVVGATVKGEFLDALGRLNGLDALECWRLLDGGTNGHGSTRHFLGRADEYLAKERPGGSG